MIRAADYLFEVPRESGLASTDACRELFGLCGWGLGFDLATNQPTLHIWSDWLDDHGKQGLTVAALILKQISPGGYQMGPSAPMRVTK